MSSFPALAATLAETSAAELRAVDDAIQAPLSDAALAVLPVLAAPSAASSAAAAVEGGVSSTRALLPGAELVAVAWTSTSLHRDAVACMALLPEDGTASGGYLDVHLLRASPDEDPAAHPHPQKDGSTRRRSLAEHRWMPPCLATSGYDCTVRVVERASGRPIGALTVETTVSTGAPSLGVHHRRPVSSHRSGPRPVDASQSPQASHAPAAPATVTRGRLWNVPIDAAVLNNQRAGELTLAL